MTRSGEPAKPAGGGKAYADLSSVRRQRLQMCILRSRPPTATFRRWTLGLNCRFVDLWE